MQRTKLLLSFCSLIFVTTCVFGQSADTTTRIGVVDLSVVTALHPLMSLYDFNRKGFLQVEFGLDARTQQEHRQQLSKQAELNKSKLENEIASISTDYEAIKQKQFILLNSRKTATGQDSETAMSKQIDENEQKLNELYDQRNILRFRIKNPDLLLPEETDRILQRIESEVLNAVEKVAERQKYDLVLNGSLPNTKVVRQPACEILSEENLSLVETDLYYAYLINHPKNSPDQANLGIKRDEEQQEKARRWLQQSRQPAVQKQLPINPHPLVLRGGEDMTPAVVKTLLQQYKCDAKVIEGLEKILIKRNATNR